MPTTLNPTSIRQYIEEHLFRINASNAGYKDKIGLELETYPCIKKEDHLYHQLSMEPLFNGLLNTIDTNTDFDYLETPKKGHPSNLLFTSGDSIQFEPGGQLELVTRPYNNIGELIDRFHKIKDITRTLSKSKGYEFQQIGYQQNISNDRFALKLTGKNGRYASMLEYFNGISAYGKKMMLQTCSMHINIDIGIDDQEKSRRLLLANLLVPYVSAIFAHSPYKSSQQIIKSYRSFIWQHLDSKRAGILDVFKQKKLMPLEEIVEAYENFILDAPVLLTIHGNEDFNPYTFSFRSWLQSKNTKCPPTIDDFKHHLTLLFPEVRIKGYLELRTPDAPPEGWELPIIQFYTALLYDTDHCEEALSIIASDPLDFNQLLKESCLGLDSDALYPRCLELMQLAEQTYEKLAINEHDTDHHDLSAFADKYTYQRKTFSDHYLA